MNEIENCQGCGIQIQTKEPNLAGYVPKSALNKNETILCRRCFRLKHYNETEDVGFTDDDFHQMISEIQNKHGIVVHIIDLFDVQGSIISSLPRITGNKPTILVGNKIDLLPKSTNRRKLEQWLRSSAREAGITLIDVSLVSATKGYGLTDLKGKIERHRNRQDVFVVGTTNVGKSTLINKLIQDSTGMRNVITTSYFPGTTLGFIEIPLDDHSALIDTPGIVNKQQMFHYVSEQELKVIMPQKEIKPRGYQLESNQTLFFGGLIRFDVIRGSKTPYICYASNELKIHRTKLENAESLYARQLGEILTPPSKQFMEKLPPMKQSTFKIVEDDIDIVFPGLGWVTINDGDVTVVVHHPEDVHVTIRNSFVERGR